jgi:hypothetical protein
MNQSQLSPMKFMNPWHELEDIVSAYEQEFCIRMSLEDADRMLTLFTELCDIFQNYDDDDRGPLELFAPLIG